MGSRNSASDRKHVSCFASLPTSQHQRLVDDLHTKLQLEWVVTHSPPHSKLSFNVVREICSYLGGNDRDLIAVHQDFMEYMDISTGARQVLKLREKVCVDWSSSSAVIEVGTVFVCGGGTFAKACIRYLDDTAYILKGNGKAYELSKMQSPRSTAGVVYDRTRRTVYVFGGANHCGCIVYPALSSSEAYSVSSSSWKSMPDMHRKRSSFNPCMHSSLVYLCGGWSKSVEYFNTRSNTFTLVPGLTLAEAVPCAAVAISGSLIVITDNSIAKWDLRRERMTEFSLNGCYPWSNCVPVVSKGVVYLTEHSTVDCRSACRVYGINLQVV